MCTSIPVAGVGSELSAVNLVNLLISKASVRVCVCVCVCMCACKCV